MTATPPSNAMQARLKAVHLAREELLQLDMVTVCSRTGLKNDELGRVSLPYVGRNAVVDFSRECSVEYSDGSALLPMDEALLLRYCAVKAPIKKTVQLITFRDMPGGTFYLQPILNRTSHLITSRFQNDVNGFKDALSGFPHAIIPGADFAVTVTVNAIGILDVTFTYRCGDEEFPCSIDLAFDKIMATIFTLDEAAALAHRLCLAIVQSPASARG